MLAADRGDADDWTVALGLGFLFAGILDFWLAVDLLSCTVGLGINFLATQSSIWLPFVLIAFP